MTDYIKVEKKDVKELAELAKGIWFEYYGNLLTLSQIYYMVNKFQSEMALNEQLDYENYTYYFVEEDGKKIGYFGYVLQPEQLFLSKLYLSKDFRSKGLGIKAFEKIKEIAKENNLNKIHLTVNKQNFKAILRYEKWGLKTLHPLVTRIGNGYVMDDYLMEYVL